ncbi:MAG TPA: hypothetical protein VK963_04210, partial [Candidatus Saccharimonadales bacterium]|nr:hypothetical protein [Candidatus Saccharimonadales bacterium]
MRRRRALAGLVVATMVGGLAFVQLAQASDQISCADVPPQTGGWRHAAGHAANGGGIADAAHPHYTGPGEESFDIGPVYKNCFEYIFRVLQKQSPNWLQGLAWFEPVVADTGQQLLPSTHTRVIASTELTGGDSFWDNVSSYNLESYVAVSGADHDNKIPGTDGVVRFSRNPEQFGRIDENQSKGRRQPIQYERAKLRPGVNAVCVKHYFLSTRNNKINSQSTIGTYCSEVTLTSNPPIVGYDNVVTVAGRLGTPGGTVASPQLGFGPGDEIFLNIRARNQGGDPSPAVTLTAYRPTSPPTSPGTPYQSFNHPDIPPGGDRNNDYSYIIPAGTPAGTVLCFGGEV